MLNRTAILCLAVVFLTSFIAAAQSAPAPPGKLVDLGGHRLHVNCSGKGSPTVVIENGLGDFSFDCALVQGPVSKFARICTYDRAGHARSDPGPMPRSFAQLNLELRDALSKLGEKGPYVHRSHAWKSGSTNTCGRLSAPASASKAAPPL